MHPTSLRILVVEDDYFLAQQLTEEIKALGDDVIGPFPDVHDAIHYVDFAGAAILDIRLGEETSFDIAACLMHRETPFVFYTGLDKRNIPPRLGPQRVVLKPSNTEALVHALRKEAARRDPRDALEVADLLPELRHNARRLVHDRQAADRLAEAVLLRAIERAQDLEGGLLQGERLRQWLLDLLALEFAQNAKRYFS